MAAVVNFLSVAAGLACGSKFYFYTEELGRLREEKKVYALVEKLERPELDAMKRRYLAEIDAAVAADSKGKA